MLFGAQRQLDHAREQLFRRQAGEVAHDEFLQRRRGPTAINSGNRSFIPLPLWGSIGWQELRSPVARARAYIVNCVARAVSMNWMAEMILPFLTVHRSQNSVVADLPVGL